MRLPKCFNLETSFKAYSMDSEFNITVVVRRPIAPNVLGMMGETTGELG